MKPRLKSCPTCGSPRLKLVQSDFTSRVRNKIVVVPKLERYECPACREVLFDYDAVKRLEEARRPRKKLSRSA